MTCDWLVCTYHSTIADLDRLNQMQGQLGSLCIQEKTRAETGSLVDLIGTVDGAEGGRKVGQDTGQSNVESRPGHVAHAERILDRFLQTSRVSAFLIHHMSHHPGASGRAQTTGICVQYLPSRPPTSPFHPHGARA
jgi:hypothetical protein